MVRDYLPCHCFYDAYPGFERSRRGQVDWEKDYAVGMGR